MVLILIAATLSIPLSMKSCVSMDGDIGTSQALFGCVMVSVLHAVVMKQERFTWLLMDQIL